VIGLSEVARNPIHATGVGLLLYGQRSRRTPRSKPIDTRTREGLFKRMTEWFKQNF
jgi:cell division protein FtsA